MHTTIPTSVLNLDSLKTTELNSWVSVWVGQEKPYSYFTFQPASFPFLYLVKHFFNDSTFVSYTLLVRKTFVFVHVDTSVSWSLPTASMSLFPAYLVALFMRPPKVSSGSVVSFVDIHPKTSQHRFFDGDLSGVALASCLPLTLAI